MHWKIKIILVTALAALTGGCISPTSEPEFRPVIEVAELHDLMALTTPIALIDVRPEAEYLKGHLPEAVNLWRTDLEADTLYGGMALGRELFEQKLSDLGFSAEHRFVIYDDRGGVEASRVYWMLKRCGLDGMQLLKGGLQAWDGAIAAGPFKAVRADFVFPGRERPEMDLDYATFENLRRHPGVRLIDSRSEAEFSGVELKSGAFAAGHIPGAAHMCYSNCVDYAPVPFLKETAALEALYAPLASREDTVIVYCHSGVRSAYVWFVLSELLNYPHVYNYDGSWTEWSYFQTTADKISRIDK